MTTQLDGIEDFFGLEIERFDSEIGVQDSNKAIKLSIDYEAADEGKTFEEEFKILFNDPKVHEIQALILGCWEEPYDGSTQDYIDLLVKNAAKLKGLKAIYTGDMDQEENEISWINQGDHSALLKAFPNLEELRTKGGNDLSFGAINMNKLKKIVIMSGGLPSNVIEEIASAKLPALEHLELWFGTDEYGFSGNRDDLERLIKGNLYSKLKYLGLVNCQMQDDIVELIVRNPSILKNLERLDLSLGTLSDKGGNLLLSCPQIKLLPALEITRHYMSDMIVNKLKQIKPTFIITEPEDDEDDEDNRYVAVSE